MEKIKPNLFLSYMFLTDLPRNPKYFIVFLYSFIRLGYSDLYFPRLPCMEKPSSKIFVPVFSKMSFPHKKE